MKRKSIVSLAFLILTVSLSVSLYAQQVIPWMTFADWPQNGDLSQYSPEQYIFLDSRTGEWVVSYPEDLNNQFSRRIELRFGSYAEVRPVILPHVEQLADGSYSYTYILQNGPLARTPIENWRMAVAANDGLFQSEHPGWNIAQVGSGTTLGFPGPFGLKWFQWSANEPNQLIPRGGAQGPFTVRSASAPGFTVIWARGKVNRLYGEHIAATLPQLVAEQFTYVMKNSSKGHREVTLGPWFPPGTAMRTIVANFQYGISRLAAQRLVDADGPFVRGVLAALAGYIQSGETATFFDRQPMDFLSQAAPGLESEIAAALRLSLSR